MFHSTRGTAAWGAALAAVLLTAGCGGSDASDDAAAYDPDAPVTIDVGLFGTFGFEEAGLYDEYMELHPNVTIKETSVEQSADYYKALQTRLAAGSGLADIQGIEIGFVSDIVTNHADQFEDFAQRENADEVKGTFYDWKYEEATTEDGRVLGLGTDSGPQALCFRKDLFQQAGLPTDRAQLGQLWSDWDGFIELGKQYAASPTKPADSAFLDSVSSIFSAAVRQGDQAYNDEDGNPALESSDGVESAWGYATAAADAGLSAGLSQFGDEWNSAFANGAFATIACPAWMVTRARARGTSPRCPARPATGAARGSACPARPRTSRPRWTWSSGSPPPSSRSRCSPARPTSRPALWRPRTRRSPTPLTSTSATPRSARSSASRRPT
jgi:cellobiose transport system substrate-binding protein